MRRLQAAWESVSGSKRSTMAYLRKTESGCQSPVLVVCPEYPAVTSAALHGGSACERRGIVQLSFEPNPAIPPNYCTEELALKSGSQSYRC